jgi:hypothetical protein
MLTVRSSHPDMPPSIGDKRLLPPHSPSRFDERDTYADPDSMNKKLDIIEQSFAKNLSLCIQKAPEKYAFGVEMIPKVARRFRHAVETGQFEFGDASIMMCKELGIKPNPKGIGEYLSG